MPQSENWPFQRLLVDHLFEGTTRVWWTLYPNFNDPQPLGFQLQAGYTSNGNALDWVDIGEQAINTYYLDDDTRHERSGKQLLTNYRVVLTTSRGRYVSGAQGIYGTLGMKDWLFARELLRKEGLRNDLVSKPGYILKRMRYGVQSAGNTDTLTNEIVDSDYRASWGTAFQVGYHPPVNAMMDFAPMNLQEQRGGADISMNNFNPADAQGRIIGFVDLVKEDVWVDATTDERWVIGDISTAAAWRGIPIAYNVALRQLAFNNIIYKIPVTNLSYDPTDQSHFQPTVGCGSIRVDHDYPTQSNLVYQTGDCCGVDGATIMAFKMVDWNGGNRVAAAAVAISQTTTNGTWAWAMQLNPGEYMLVFEKTGEYGPDAVRLTVDVPDPGPPPSLSSLSVSVGSEPAPVSPPTYSSGFGDF